MSARALDLSEEQLDAACAAYWDTDVDKIWGDPDLWTEDERQRERERMRKVLEASLKPWVRPLTHALELAWESNRERQAEIAGLRVKEKAAAIIGSIEAFVEMLRMSFTAGFTLSGEGWNGEHPYNFSTERMESDTYWTARRKKVLDELAAEAVKAVNDTDRQG